MKRSEKRILTTHVGSLVRAPELKALAHSSMDRPADMAPTRDYIETLQLATAEVVRKQAAIGLDIVSDGEFGKSSWSNYVLNRVTGFEIRPEQLRPVEWLGRDLARFGDVIAREAGGLREVRVDVQRIAVAAEAVEHRLLGRHVVRRVRVGCAVGELHGLRLAAAFGLDGKAQESLHAIEALRLLPKPISDDPRIDLQEALTCDHSGDYQCSKRASANAASKA